jgi:hypothetical protein
MAGCAFDRSGLGTHAADDAGAGGMVDAPGGGTGTGAPLDAKPEGVPDAMVVTPPDASVNEGVVCGNQTCSGSNVCCVSLGSGGGTHYECDDKCGNNAATFSCDGPEDCKQDESCCFTQLGSRCGKTCGPQQDVACRDASDCPIGFGGQPQMCCPTQFPNVELCQDFCF